MGFFPKIPTILGIDDALQSFILQFYLAGNKTIPKQIVLPQALPEQDAVADALSEHAKYKVKFFAGARDSKRRYLELANKNAENALISQQTQQKSMFARYKDLESVIERDEPIQRMECFDISHTSGQQTVASCVVFNRDAPLKSDYRLYNIEGITGGDD